MSQGTGLVLSGGGAKGLAHVGVIKALEDNNVRIDYVSGTSMGAIVGALYSMGYTTGEMMDLFKSDDFSRWKTGEIEPRYQFRYKSGENNPSIISVPLKRDREKATAQIRTYLIPSHVMDFAFMELTCGADAAAGSNFDSLMVPFRCVAADIYRKEAVIFRKGNLAKGVRTSMTYPIVFEPITVNSQLLFDGGIYNNFPFGVLIDDFNPDFIIGSKVVNRAKKPSKDDIMSQLENMIMQPTDYNIPDSIGVVISSDLKNIDLLDFEKADSLFDAGYKEAMKMMPEILKRASFMSDSELESRRENFRAKIPELNYKNIYINGVSSAQEEYIRNQISKQEEVFDLAQLKEEYFRLISEENILSAFPEAVYNRENESFDLLLDIKLKGVYNLSAGGLLSFTNYNQAYLGFDYFLLSDIFNRFSGNLYLGRFYSSFNLSHHIAIPQKSILLIDLNLVGNRWNYYRNDLSTLFDTYLPSYIIRNETSFSASAGKPLSANSTIKGGISFSWINDNYHQTRRFDEEAEPDNTEYFFSTAKIVFQSDNHDQRQFATNGNKLKGGIYFNTGFEFFDVTATDTIDSTEESNVRHNWLAIRFRNENYTSLTERIKLGSLVDITLSNRKFSGNYTSTLINSYRFTPTPFSGQIYGQSLRSNSYMAGGLTPMFKLSNTLTIRTGVYLFAPLYPVRDMDNKPEYDDLLSELRAIAELGLVYHTPVGPISAGINYFSHESRKAYYYLNFGYILFNKSGLD